MLQRQKSKLQLQTALVRYWRAKSGRALASIVLRTSPSDAGYKVEDIPGTGLHALLRHVLRVCDEQPQTWLCCFPRKGVTHNASLRRGGESRAHFPYVSYA